MTATIPAGCTFPAMDQFAASPAANERTYLSIAARRHCTKCFFISELHSAVLFSSQSTYTFCNFTSSSFNIFFSVSYLFRRHISRSATMRFSSSVLATAGLLSTADAAIKGFNYGANFGNQQAKTVLDFEYEFNAAKNLPGTNGWTSARLYTMIQHNTQNTPIEAIEAAINTNTTLLLGMWASAGQAVMNNEVAALKAAISQYGTRFTDLVVGISVGSEDLYRITPTGIENHSGAGAQPQELISYVQQTRAAIRGTPLDGKPIGHVDTYVTSEHKLHVRQPLTSYTYL
jgi:exo-beta-1,3-glucanase (GH17 family)